MTTSETSTLSIQDIVLGTLEIMNRGKGELYQKWNEENGFSNFVALASFMGLCSLTEDGEEAIRKAFSSLASMLEITERELLESVLEPE